jgi:rhamnulokinase
LLRELSIPTHFLPEIIEPGISLGRISESLAKELGVSKSTSIVAPACHDTGSAVAAAPLENNRSAYISSGTWSLIGIEVEEPVINKESLACNFTNEGGVFRKFRLLRNVQGMWLVQECKRIWASQGRDLSYDELVRLAHKARPFVALIDPDDPRFIAPPNMVDETMGFLAETRQDKPKNEAEFVRIILESLAFKYRNVVEQLEDLTGLAINQINVVGGGARNRLLNQMTADFMGVSVVAGPIEATSIGNILMQAVAMKLVETHEDLRSIVKNSFELKRYEPNPNADVEDAYRRFTELTHRKWT